MPPGEQVALQPAFALVLAEHRVQHASGGREIFVLGHGRGVPLTVGHFKERSQAIRKRLVRTEDPKVSLLPVQLRDIAQKGSEHTRVTDASHSRRWHGFRVVAEIRHPQVAEQRTAVGVRIRPHASFAFGGKLGQFRFQAARSSKSSSGR